MRSDMAKVIVERPRLRRYAWNKPKGYQRRLLARWGDTEDPCTPGNFFAPHDVWADDRGDLYVGEVVLSAGGSRGLVSPSCHALQKFVRRSS